MRISGKQKIAWLFLLPILLLNLVVVIVPSFSSIYYSFTDWSGMGSYDFVGLDNFKELFTDEIFLKALLNNVKWTIFFVTIPVAIGLIVSISLISLTRGQMFFRVLFFIPYILPSIVNANLWKNILSPYYGIIPWLQNLGFDIPNIKFFANSEIVLYSIAFIDNWRFWGYLVILYLAALQAIPKDHYEVGELEGISKWQRFKYITIPGILPTLSFSLMMITIWSFLVFDYVYILTQGGPANASEVLGTLVYKTAFSKYEMGYASAISIAMSFFCLLPILTFNLLKKRGRDI